jgi:glycosyltransferase involved in cell wall biosynthesis
MTILFFTRLYLPHVGGVEKHIYEISKILSKNYKIIIVAEQDDPSEPEYEKTDVTEVYRIPLSGVGESAKKWHIWKWLFAHLQLIKSSDLIHIHDVFFWYLPFRFLYPNHKSYITFHGYEGDEIPSLRKIFWHQLAARFTNGNICIGDFHRKWYQINPTFVSYGAVELPKNKKAVSQTESAIFIGRLAPDNGIMDYLEAVRTLHLSLDVYGDGPQKSQAIEYVNNHKLAVRFMGYVPDSSRFILNHRYAFISRYLGILEALASQVPIIAHYNNSIKNDYLSLAPFASYINIVGDPSQIVASMTQIRDNYPKSKIKAGFTWVRTQTWLNLVNLYTALWTPTKSPL